MLFPSGYNNDCNFDVLDFSREAIHLSFTADTDNEQENEEGADANIGLPFIGFLAVINECSSRLLQQDKKTV